MELLSFLKPSKTTFLAENEETAKEIDETEGINKDWGFPRRLKRNPTLKAIF